MSRYQEDKSQHCPIRVFQPKPGQPTTIINPNNKLRTDIPECEGTDGALFYAVDKLGRCTGNRGRAVPTPCNLRHSTLSHFLPDRGFPSLARSIYPPARKMKQVLAPWNPGIEDLLSYLLCDWYCVRYGGETTRGGRKLHTLTLDMDMGTVEMELLLL